MAFTNDFRQRAIQRPTGSNQAYAVLSDAPKRAVHYHKLNLEGFEDAEQLLLRPSKKIIWQVTTNPKARKLLGLRDLNQ